MEEYKKTQPPIQYALEKLTIYMLDRKFREIYNQQLCFCGKKSGWTISV